MPRNAKLSERGRKTGQAVAKCRARSLKRETGGGAPATQTRSTRRTRERHT